MDALLEEKNYSSFTLVHENILIIYVSEKCVQDGGAASRGIIRKKNRLLFLNPDVVFDPEVYSWTFSALTTVSTEI